MQMNGIPFGVTDWAALTPTRHAGASGQAAWRTQRFGDIRVRMVEYTLATPPIIGAPKGTCCCASPAS